MRQGTHDASNFCGRHGLRAAQPSVQALKAASTLGFALDHGSQETILARGAFCLLVLGQFLLNKVVPEVKSEGLAGTLDQAVAELGFLRSGASVPQGQQGLGKFASPSLLLQKARRSRVTLLLLGLVLSVLVPVLGLLVAVVLLLREDCQGFRLLLERRLLRLVLPGRRAACLWLRKGRF